mmetsp:Transcript_5751/g.4943  ORF Transcript_5751/g.4943 Transcript_5751/m.4943 type:complete len:219 (+) Transcript_5751:690-1346(+)
MLTGLPPFYTPNREELFEKIRYYTLKYPPFLSPNVKSLLEGLFKKEPDKRLGGGPDGAKEIKSHDWFENLDWDMLLRKEYPAPFVPVIKDDTDVSNFDPEFTETPIIGSYDGGDGMMYQGWSYNGSESMKFGLNISNSNNPSLGSNSSGNLGSTNKSPRGGFDKKSNFGMNGEGENGKDEEIGFVIESNNNPSNNNPFMNNNNNNGNGLFNNNNNNNN